ncbi:MAG TPA: redox-regulated ATPase YchF [Verrucomicrobiales bacterium]|nr:redox-regulated ATPase YchF [Verrucomicrobiales bacterium]
MLRAGIVGLPNVGKSTLFNAVTRTRKAEAANYPFCTIEPNQGVVTVPDARLDVLAQISHSERVVPAAVEFVDIAGLVRGASRGEGLGNQFLGNIREVDAVIQVVRCFESSHIHHMDGAIDPVRDIEVINTELLLADLAALERRRDRNEKKAKGGDRDAKSELTLIARLALHLDAGKPAATLEVTEEERRLLRGFFLLTAKPTIYACNVAESDLASALDDPGAHPHVRAVREHAAREHQALCVTISARIESDLVDLSPEEAAEYLASLGVESSGVEQLIRAVYELLGLRTYLTTGDKETRAWTIRAGDRAPRAAGVIHGDFERGFIAAEVVSYPDLVNLGSMSKAREAGRLRIEGKDYEVRDGDVIEFRFNV